MGWLISSSSAYPTIFLNAWLHPRICPEVLVMRMPSIEVSRILLRYSLVSRISFDRYIFISWVNSSFSSCNSSLSICSMALDMVRSRAFTSLKVNYQIQETENPALVINDI